MGNITSEILTVSLFDRNLLGKRRLYDLALRFSSGCRVLLTNPTPLREQTIIQMLYYKRLLIMELGLCFMGFLIGGMAIAFPTSVS
jgi:hypothetical protein